MSAPVVHGGNLDQAIARFGGARTQWLDLSTGINPSPYPITPLTAACLAALPESPERLERCASAHYGVDSTACLAVPGSQWAIEALASRFRGVRVLAPFPGYQEHEAAFLKQGTTVERYDGWLSDQALFEAFDRSSASLLVIISPNNPTGRTYARATLIRLGELARSRGGAVIVDQAFIDPQEDEAYLAPHHLGVITLRSFGKFFGLAGVRLGFVLGTDESLSSLRARRGPWAVSTAAIEAGTQALGDTRWVSVMRQTLARWQREQDQLWQGRLGQDAQAMYSTPLFTTYDMTATQAKAWQVRLAGQHLWTRLWPVDESRALLRIGRAHEDALGLLGSRLAKA
ncbi:aminotransferase class I/II-fold pyridoxal phosphate-dependent enzyme [Larsenimonas suaedae]|uniref:Aminotransferase class I/II-fold pyridoxal phosphate-dependent enzyme n=1 Tax=Larsenimonas suaedae TaxID=1851019 RepID=A0ABU1GXL7_9GAMM|nr:aminotransferase class I/II-fold pyridoxal phosphate-dependent enzyme [Larsenimonas suaedae]MCM2971530.1 aminotransferase class I/II-fold pyridoxal phosphate-dependent enzyme [Larsenimonas suaedae]MDR5896786.1 aminotransferase class I/II-fold pyridoxal phosphate-dependent enzyme [Larsenimonas suaedae]